MRTVNITNEKKRDAQVCMEAVKKPSDIRRVLADGGEYMNIKVLKQNLALAFETLSQSYDDLRQMGEALMAGDPEIDMEIIGKKIGETQKLYLDRHNKIAYRVNMTQIIRDAQGNERERRDLAKAMSNVTGESIIQWTGKKFPKRDIIRKFVFQRKLQLKHISGLTYDFLYDMAKSLHESEAMMFIGGGKKGNEPLILTQGGEPYRGFLEGRIKEETYCLILHLTNMEMKIMDAGPAAGGDAS
ncbi:MAG: hypothetical protein LBB49_03505 [Gracilibacteraceae bacterium]|jgi:hypothetical protein|nr:hypothetical protein [Gracilibacteraceae bacterium]